MPLPWAGIALGALAGGGSTQSTSVNTNATNNSNFVPSNTISLGGGISSFPSGGGITANPSLTSGAYAQPGQPPSFGGLAGLMGQGQGQFQAQSYAAPVGGGSSILTIVQDNIVLLAIGGLALAYLATQKKKDK